MAKYKLGVIVGSNRKDLITASSPRRWRSSVSTPSTPSSSASTTCRSITRTTSSRVPAPVARMKAEIEAADAVVRHRRAQPLDPGGAEERHRRGARPYGKNSWTGKPATVTGTTSGAISTAVAQTHLRAVLNSGVGMHVLGGEAYIQFKPELIDATGTVTDDGVRKFLNRLHRQLRRLRHPLRAAADRRRGLSQPIAFVTR